MWIQESLNPVVSPFSIHGNRMVGQIPIQYVLEKESSWFDLYTHTDSNNNNNKKKKNICSRKFALCDNVRCKKLIIHQN